MKEWEYVAMNNIHEGRSVAGVSVALLLPPAIDYSTVHCTESVHPCQQPLKIDVIFKKN